MSTIKTQQFVPSDEVLSNEIAEDLDGSPDPVPSAQEYRKQLLIEHPEWQISEQRIKKFLKMHTDKQKGDDAAVDVVKPKPTKRKSRKGFFRALFKRGSSKNVVVTEKDQIPPVLEPAPLQETAPPTPEPADKIELVIPEEVVVLEADPMPQPPPLEPVSEEVDVYEDDNTGSKKENCECQSCVIL